MKTIIIIIGLIVIGCYSCSDCAKLKEDEFIIGVINDKQIPEDIQCHVHVNGELIKISHRICNDKIIVKYKDISHTTSICAHYSKTINGN